jgi:hypothetical protein
MKICLTVLEVVCGWTLRDGEAERSISEQFLEKELEIHFKF